MRNPLAAHPPSRQLLAVSVVLPAVIALAVLAFAWPAARVQPRDVPVGIVGATPASEQFVREADARHPGAFDFRLYPDASAAAHGIRTRDVYGAFVVTSDRMQVLTASAASPAVSALLTQTGQQLLAGLPRPGPGSGTPLAFEVADLVPMAAADPHGLVFSASMLPLTICSLLIAGVVAVLVRFRPAWRQLTALTVVSAVSAAGVYLVVQTFLGGMPAAGWPGWATLGLTMLAMNATTAGLIALVGVGGLALAGALFVIVGNAFSAVSAAPELLPGAVRRIGQWLPPGAGANMLRSVAYFGGDGAGAHLGVLAAWVAFGTGAIILGHHAPIRFAAVPDQPPRRHVAHTAPAAIVATDAPAIP